MPFVELEVGVEGLVHISELSDQHINRVADVVQTDQTVDVRILDVDEQSRRIGLSMKGLVGSALPADQQPVAQPTKKRKKPLKGGLD